VAMGLFEATYTSRVTMATQVKELLLSYNLLDKLITYVKDEGGNLSTLARALSYVVSYVPLKLATNWQGSFVPRDLGVQGCHKSILLQVGDFGVTWMCIRCLDVGSL